VSSTNDRVLREKGGGGGLLRRRVEQQDGQEERSGKGRGAEILVIRRKFIPTYRLLQDRPSRHDSNDPRPSKERPERGTEVEETPEEVGDLSVS